MHQWLLSLLICAWVSIDPHHLTAIVPCSSIQAECLLIDPLVAIAWSFSRFELPVANVNRICASPPDFVYDFDPFFLPLQAVLPFMSIFGLKIMVLAADLLLSCMPC